MVKNLFKRIKEGIGRGSLMLIAASSLWSAGCNLPYKNNPKSNPEALISSSQLYGEASPQQPLSVLFSSTGVVTDTKDPNVRIEQYHLDISDKATKQELKDIDSRSPIKTIFDFTGAEDVEVSGYVVDTNGNRGDANPLEEIITAIPVVVNPVNPINPVNPLPPPANTDLAVYLQFQNASGSATNSYHVGDPFTFYAQIENNTNPYASITLDNSNLNNPCLEYILFEETNPGQINPSSDKKMLDQKLNYNMVITLNQNGWYILQQRSGNTMDVSVSDNNSAQVTYNGVDVTSLLEGAGLGINAPDYAFKESGQYYTQVVLNYNKSESSDNFTFASPSFAVQ